MTKCSKCGKSDIKYSPKIYYHGTTEENAKKILKEGFKLNYSYDMFLGRGIYLSYCEEDAKQYGDGTVLKVLLPENINLAQDTQMCCGIGIYESFKEIEDDYRENNNMKPLTDEQMGKLYFEFAEDQRKINLDDGFQGACTETQCVIYDQNVIKKLKIAI